MDPIVGHYLNAVVMVLVAVPQVLRVRSGTADAITWSLLVGAVCLLSSNIWFIVRLRRARRRPS